MRYDPNQLTAKQFKLARAFESAGITTISQAIKAFVRKDDERIEEWKRQLKEKVAANT